ncbi:MAG: hypothetical protein HOP08_02685 [Cyclobacteriaceae bacterium]|nr:hypothetical protein [Cyclobacteriaceae bacterium]
MKTIKSALLGFKKLDDSNPDVLLEQLREVLSQHQEILINRLLRDLPTYLDYRFNMKSTKAELDEIKDRLNYLKTKNVDLTIFDHVLQQVKTKTITQLTNEVFYTQIDAAIKVYEDEPTGNEL